MNIMLLPTFFLLQSVVNADVEERFDARADRVVHVGERTGAELAMKRRGGRWLDDVDYYVIMVSAVGVSREKTLVPGSLPAEFLSSQTPAYIPPLVPPRR